MNMQTNRRFGALSSSEYPNELATKVKGIIIALSVAIIWGASKFFQIEVTPGDVVELGTALGAVTAAIVFAYGVIKNLIIWAYEKWANRGV